MARLVRVQGVKQLAKVNKMAQRQAVIALESEVREFCLKVEELQREYGLRVAIEPITYDNPFPALQVKVEGTKTRIEWLGDE